MAPLLAGFNKTRCLKSPLISRNGCGLSRTNLHLDGSNSRRPRGLRRLEMKLECLLEIAQSFFLCLSLAGDVKLKALSNVPVAFAPDSGCEWSLHGQYCFTLRSLLRQTEKFSDSRTPRGPDSSRMACDRDCLAEITVRCLHNPHPPPLPRELSLVAESGEGL